jgi:hypothetical protein
MAQFLSRKLVRGKTVSAPDLGALSQDPEPVLMKRRCLGAK